MKKYLFFFSIPFFFTLLFLTNCSKSDLTVSKVQEPPFLEILNRGGSPLDFAASAGDLHNLACDHLKSSFNIGLYSTNSAIFTAMFSNLASYYSTQTGLDAASINPSWSKDSAITFLSKNWYPNARSVWQNYRSRSIMSQVSSSELVFVDSVYAIFNSNNNGLTRSQICDNIISKANTLLGNFNSSTWTSGNGTLALGLIHVAKSSAYYWKNNSPYTFWGTGTDPGGDVQGFIIGDCVGYLAGWTSQLWSDYNSSGGITPAGQNQRIGQGLIWDAAGSVVGP